MKQPLFITGIGTDVGKTVVAAILTEALQADYWKPVQAGYENGTDTEFVKNIVSNPNTRVYTETYKLKLAASPHIAARQEGLMIDLEKIKSDLKIIQQNRNSHLIIEGAGGLMVPLNDHEFVVDLIKKIDAKVVLVSRNYLGSINHSLLTASVCKSNNISVLGWIFNDQYLDYEDEIISWTGIPKIASIPLLHKIEKKTIENLANIIRSNIQELFADR
ncbi:MAG: dethiobiotin synthase [Bacteroidetes bacterium]|nr:dethiobiotin synthase [Bacteroidota bacterium]